MLIKKAIAWGVVGIAALGISASFAGTAVVQHTGFYADVQAGGFYRDLKGDYFNAFEISQLHAVADAAYIYTVDSDTVSYARGKFGVAAGGNLGYRLDRYFSIEGGGYWLQKQKMSAIVTGHGIYGVTLLNANDTGTTSVASWLVYAGMKIQANVSPNLDAFAKIGGAYVRNKIKNIVVVTGEVSGNGTFDYSASYSYWKPCFAFGFGWDVYENANVSLQYFFVPTGRSDKDAYTDSSGAAGFTGPIIQILTLGLGYKF